MLRALGIVALLVPALAVADGPVRATLGEDGVQRVELTGGSYFFEPAHIVVRVGQPVELTLRRGRGLAPHDFHLRLPGEDIHVEFGSDPVTVTFTPREPGAYGFHCTKDPPFFRSHRERGMDGVLEVVE